MPIEIQTRLRVPFTPLSVFDVIRKIDLDLALANLGDPIVVGRMKMLLGPPALAELVPGQLGCEYKAHPLRIWIGVIPDEDNPLGVRLFMVGPDDPSLLPQAAQWDNNATSWDGGATTWDEYR